MAATDNFGLPAGTQADAHPPHGRSKKQEEHYELPSAARWKEAGELYVYDESGASVQFKSLYENKAGTQQLIVFIRHFFDSSSEDYVRLLSNELPPIFLAQTTPKTHLTIIGCGDMGVIPSYRLRTIHDILGAEKGYPIYSDPNTKLYSKLGMMSNLGVGDETPEYVKKGPVAGVLEGIKNAAMAGTSALSGGHPSQNGGEMLIADGELVWFKRMRHTQDHAEIAELREVIGLT